MCDNRLSLRLGIDFVLQNPIGVCHALVLTQMFQPGFDKKCFQEPARHGRILEYVPSIRSVAFAFVREQFDGLKKFLSVLRIDPVLDRYQDRTGIGLNCFTDDGLWPMHCRREIDTAPVRSFHRQVSGIAASAPAAAT